MAHGGPDWGTAGPLGTVFTLEDMAELAARLGSIDTFDRRGNIIWLDDFEDGIEKWILDGSGVAWAITWDSTRARSGAFSAKLVTTPLTDSWVQLEQDIVYPAPSRLGFEFSTSLSTVLGTLFLHVQIFDGTLWHVAEVIWTRTTGRWQYWDGAYHDLEPIMPLYSDVPIFHTIKLVVDPIKAEYARLLVDTVVYPMAGLKYEIRGLVTAPFLYFLIRNTVLANNASAIYVDDVIVTQNEP